MANFSIKTDLLKLKNRIISTDDNRAGSTQKHPKSIISFQKPHPSIAQHRTEKSIEMLEWLVK